MPENVFCGMVEISLTMPLVGGILWGEGWALGYDGGIVGFFISYNTNVGFFLLVRLQLNLPLFKVKSLGDYSGV